MKGYFDIAGDGGSDVVGQVKAKHARIAESLSGVGRILAIGSGKGGVGKSTLTREIALALRRRGLAAAILDADLNGPSQARLSGLTSRPPIPGARGLVLPRAASGIGVLSMGAMVPESKALDFDSVAPSDSYVWRATREFTLLGDILAGVEWGALDFLLVDLPPGAERTFQYAEFLGPGAEFVVVTVPSDLSRGVVARSIAALAKAPNRLLGFVENMKGYYCSGCASVRPLFAESGAIDLGIPCLGSVPFDPELAAACDRGEVLDEPERLTVRAIDAVVAGLLEVS